MEKVNADSAIIFIGNFVHCNSDTTLNAFDGHVVVEDGRITSVGEGKSVEEICQGLGLSKYVVTELLPSQLIVPGFVDCHLHAPQFPNLGLGYDKPLMDWLGEYTFPLEKQYQNTQFAETVFNSVVRRTLRNGTTTACYFSSLHLASSLALARACAERGQRARVGKVSMSSPNEAGYYNPPERELADTEAFVRAVRQMENDLVEPVITPRFALSCDMEMMKSLSAIAKEYGCMIQTHVAENLTECELIRQAYPDCDNYCDVYFKAGLFDSQCILAHGIYLDEAEMQMLREHGTSLAHCPASNTRLRSGLCPLRQLLQRGVSVGLGTDVSGGDSPSILDAIKRCMDVSINLALLKGETSDTRPITWTEAFYLATLGGAKALFLDDKTGNFEVGKEFDALIVDIHSKDTCIDHYEVPNDAVAHHATSRAELASFLLQKFLYLGDHRNIVKVFVKGREISL